MYTLHLVLFTLDGIILKFWTFPANFGQFKPYCETSYIVSVEAALRQRITDLQRYRQAGLRWLRSAKLYDKMATTQRSGQPQLLNDVLRYIQVCY